MSDGGTQVGLTAGVGWEVGLSRTLAVPADAVWAWLQSPAGQDVWLAPGARARPERGSPVTVAGDPVGTVRSGGTGRRNALRPLVGSRSGGWRGGRRAGTTT